MADRRLEELRRQHRAERSIVNRARTRKAKIVENRHMKRLRWLGVLIRRRKAYLKAKHDGKFQPWMLNGCPGNIEPQVQSIIAVAVTRYGLVVTATTNGSHVPGSFHYPWNNPRHNGKGRAADLASWSQGKMQNFQGYVFVHAARFDEGFGPPNNRFVKFGTIYNGSIPNHYNHNHVAPRYGARF